MKRRRTYGLCTLFCLLIIVITKAEDGLHNLNYLFTRAVEIPDMIESNILDKDINRVISLDDLLTRIIHKPQPLTS